MKKRRACVSVRASEHECVCLKESERWERGQCALEECPHTVRNDQKNLERVCERGRESESEREREESVWVSQAGISSRLLA